MPQPESLAAAPIRRWPEATRDHGKDVRRPLAGE